MSPTGQPWPRASGRLRERPRALAAVAIVALVVVAASFGIGLAAGGGDSDGRKQAKTTRQVKGTLANQSRALQAAQGSATSLRTRNARLARTVTIQRRRAISWKRRYLRLRRSRR
jgi:hypothetical protein